MLFVGHCSAMKLYFKSCIWFQIHEEARKFSYQTGVRVVVAYGGAPINQQVIFPFIFVSPSCSLCFPQLVMSPDMVFLVYASNLFVFSQYSVDTLLLPSSVHI